MKLTRIKQIIVETKDFIVIRRHPKKLEIIRKQEKKNNG